MWNKEIKMVEKYNEMNGTHYQIVIDNFKNAFWVLNDYGMMVGSNEMNKIWEYYGQ